MQISVRHIEAKSVDAPRQPVIENAECSFARAFVAPVELRLLAQEFVVVVLATRRMICPSFARKCRQPVVGRRAVFTRRCPDIPARPIAAAEAITEPGMLVRGV